MRVLTKWEQILRWFRFKWQRITRGWDDSELWSLDYTIAKLILPRLIEFRKNVYGHPCTITQEEWEEILDKIIWSMKTYVEDLEPAYTENYREDYFGYANRQQEGFELFGKWFGHLWW